MIVSISPKNETLKTIRFSHYLGDSEWLALLWRKPNHN